MNQLTRISSCREIEIKTAHFRYAAKQWGDKTGLPVLALHGWLDNAASFDFLAPYLDEMQLVALDFPGHGYSAHRPLGFLYHYLDYIADVVAVADALKWERFVLMGHSLGAGVASITASAIPERISRLILIEGIGAMTRDPKDAPRFLSNSIHQMKTVTKKLPPVYQTQEEMIQARAKIGDMKLSSVEALVKRNTVELENGVTWRSDPRLKITSPSYLTDEQIAAYLSAITAPTLLIQAESGIFRDKEYLEIRSGKIKQLTKTALPGGHHLHLDDPAPVAEAITAFCAL